MNWEAIGAVGEILGALAVVVSLLYLAVQIRHGANATRAASRYASAQLTTDILVAIASDPEVASIFRRGQNDPDSLSDDEGLRFDMLLYAVFDQWEKYDSSIIPMYLAQPGSQRFWETASDMYPASFREYIDQVSRKKHSMWRDNDENLQVS